MQNLNESKQQYTISICKCIEVNRLSNIFIITGSSIISMSTKH